MFLVTYLLYLDSKGFCKSPIASNEFRNLSKASFCLRNCRNSSHYELLLLSKFGVLTLQAGGAIGVYFIFKMPKLSLPTLLLPCCTFVDDLKKYEISLFKVSFISVKCSAS